MKAQGPAAVGVGPHVGGVCGHWVGRVGGRAVVSVGPQEGRDPVCRHRGLQLEGRPRRLVVEEAVAVPAVDEPTNRCGAVVVVVVC